MHATSGPCSTSLGDHWTFLGVLPNEDMSAFYAACDVTILPSLNSTESFGMVQVEVNGLRDARGCERPARRAPADRHDRHGAHGGSGGPAALAQAILDVLGNPAAYRRDPQVIAARFSSEAVAEQYERLYESLGARRA